MNDLSQILKKGTLLIIETGEYNDRTWFGPFRMLKDAMKETLAKQYKAQWKPDKDGWPDKPDPDGFISWLTVAGFIEDVSDVHSWHVGSYGRFEP